MNIHFVSKLRHLIDFAQSLAYALGKDIGERYEEWLKDPLTIFREGPEAKVTTALLLHTRASIENVSQAKQPLRMWKDARGDQATPTAMVAALRKMGTMTTAIRQKIEREFHTQDMD